MINELRQKKESEYPYAVYRNLWCKRKRKIHAGRRAGDHGQQKHSDHDQLLEDVRELLNGRRVSRKRYDYTHHCRADVPGEYLEPHDVIIVEGIHAFYDARLRAMMDLKLYMHVESDICLLRRIQRDINERGRQIDNISSQYITTVKPMFDQYIRNYEQYADVIVAGGGKDAKITEILAGYINNDLHLYRGLNRRKEKDNA